MSKTQKKTEYLTKRLIERQSRLAFRQKAKDAMALIGHTIVAEKGWIVKKNDDGTVDQLKKIKTLEKVPRKLILD
jgi:hypothetical protein